MRLVSDPALLEALFARTELRRRMPWADRYPWQLYELQKWEYLCRYGEPVNQLVLFLDGQLSVSMSTPQGRTYLVCFSQVGTLVCGDVEVASGGSNATADLRAEAVSWCAAIPLDPYRETLLNDVEFLRYALCRLAVELVHDSVYAANNLLAPLEERLAYYINFTARDGCFSANLTRLAELMGVSYRQLSRVMRAFQVRGFLVKEAADWRVIDPQGLERLGSTMAESSQRVEALKKAASGVAEESPYA